LTINISDFDTCWIKLSIANYPHISRKSRLINLFTKTEWDQYIAGARNCTKSIYLRDLVHIDTPGFYSGSVSFPEDILPFIT